MAENIMGTDSLIWGDRLFTSSPFSSRCTLEGFAPKNTLVSIGSRRGSMGGLVTWEAFSSSLSKYTG
ncbi:unknown [Ruminococcus sp. CAG:379]|nr:unknown [Ruminococcus sp. CAG:379]